MSLEERIKILEGKNNKISEQMQKLQKQFILNRSQIDNLQLEMVKDKEVTIVDLITGTYELPEEEVYHRIQACMKDQDIRHLSCNPVSKLNNQYRFSLYVDEESSPENYKNTLDFLTNTKGIEVSKENPVDIITGTEQYSLIMYPEDNQWIFASRHGYRDDDIHVTYLALEGRGFHI